MNGDGLADVVVGDRASDSAHVFLGGTTATPWLISGISSENAGFGGSIATLGDTNGDGYSDFLIGAANEDYGGQIDPGRAYLLFGGPTVPTGASETLSLPTPVNFTVFGRCVAAIGDVNGDGYADLAVGADTVDGGTRPGATYVYYGGATGITGPTVLRSPDPANQTGFGTSILGIGDIDGDGFADIAVGGPYARIGGERIGKVWLYAGGNEGIQTTPVTEISPPMGTVGVDGNFGGSLALALRPHRLFVGANRASSDASPSESGAVFVFDLAGDLSLVANISAEPPTTSERFGSALAGAGDVNADGQDDLLIGVPRARAELALLNSTGGVSDRWATSWPGGESDAVAGVGDVDLDGFDDVALGDSSMDHVILYRGATARYAEPSRVLPSSGGHAIASQAP